MNYAGIEVEINNLGIKVEEIIAIHFSSLISFITLFLPLSLFQARDGTLAVEDMDGGTFTISNGGVFGSLYGTPIINPPQSAILGMHATNDRPVAIDGKVGL